ncbi:MAG: hypothetical protein FWE66_02125, partial [Oscillospiraceae bacterium]|nr:hypothetical protein [Oscillospiraceae bacterium]
MDHNTSNDKSDKIVFRASSGDFEITESPASKKKEGGPAEKISREQKRPANNSRAKPQKGSGPKRKKKHYGWIAVVCVVLILGGLAVAAVGVVNRLIDDRVNSTMAYYLSPDEMLLELTAHSYVVSTFDEALIYLAHPSLNEGDTIVVNDHLMIDVDTEFNGFLSLGLVNFDCSAGSLTFTG